MVNNGSQWRKWDLHVHTKGTNKNDQFKSKSFDEFCVTFFQKAIENEIHVIAVTDYFSIDHYKKIKDYVEDIDLKTDFSEEEKKYIKNIYLIPNVELRMLPVTGQKKLINIHCLFNPQYVDSLENNFFTSIECSAGSGKKFKMNRQGMIDLGKDLDSSLSNEEAYKKGIDNFVLAPADLQKLVDENKKLRENTIIIVSNSNNDGASGLQKHYELFENENGSLDGARKTIYVLSDIIFSSNPKDIEYFSGNKTTISDVITKCGSLKACVHGCDAHSEEKLFKPDNDRYCWIKSDVTFEGLKQIIYEPTNRVKIQENKPQPPLHKLENVKLEFSDDVKWDNDKFCFAGFNDDIVFSPNLTCIIGGRGSGKSTLLNLIAKKIGKGDIKFFAKVKPLDIENSVIFQPETIENIEYLAQNTIEKFATDTKAFTEAIYTRLNKKSNRELEKKEFEITESLNIFNQQIVLLKERVELLKELLNIRMQLKINTNLASTFSDKIFVDAKENLTKLQKEKNIILKSRDNYKSLYESLKEIKENYQAVSEPTNNYDSYYNELLDKLNTLYSEYSLKDYTKDKEKIEKININISRIEKTIEDYLRNKGLSPENVEDAKNASQKIVELKNDRNIKLGELKDIRQKIRNFSISKLDIKINEFKTNVENELQKINDIFKKISDNNPTEVKLIEVKYELNQDIFDKVFDKLENTLNIRGEISSFRRTFIEYVTTVDFCDVLTCSNGSDFINKIEVKTTQAYAKVREIFSDNLNFNIYKLLIEEEKRNIKDNKILRVYYDNKPLDNSSFGQKCTAAIVILLSVGNNPIIIDEPEAHLDSSLIANYLVELIKQQKEQRQIIFATHNANFVLNADAELIIKLENIDGTTSVTNFTIEDLDYREDLLKLEGGKEAFKKRERKYNI